MPMSMNLARPARLSCILFICDAAVRNSLCPLLLPSIPMPMPMQSESKFAYTNVGTPFYMSPEMVNECKYNEKSDIWALGCLLCEFKYGNGAAQLKLNAEERDA